MGKGARIRRQHAQEREQHATLEAAMGLAGRQPQGAPFGAAPPWKKPTSVDEAVDQMKQFMQSMPQLIVCGRLGLTPLTETQRRESLSNINLFDALETVARLQGRWDIAITTTQRPDIVEAEFLAAGTGEACRLARKRVIDHRDMLVSPRATAQLQREIIENASVADAAAPIDRNTLVHILLSITSEQNSNPAFAGDVPTPEEIAKFEREMPKTNMTELLEYAQKFIPDEVASNLYNMPSMYEMVLTNAYDL